MATMKNYFGTLNSADDHLLRDAISANNYDLNNNNTFTNTSSSTSSNTNTGNMNQNQNSNNNNNVPLTCVTKIKDGEPYYEIRNIKTSDKKFTLKGMPFTRKLSNPDIWVTSHIKRPEFM